MNVKLQKSDLHLQKETNKSDFALARAGRRVYFAEMASVGTQAGTLSIPEIEVGTRTVPELSNGAGDWLCAWCLNRVARERDRFAYDGKDEFEFKNPEGIRFEIITFGRTLGCRQTGAPTVAYTWFPGHAWSY